MINDTIGVLVPFNPMPQNPSKRPISSALSQALGITVVFGSELVVKSNIVHINGYTASKDQWRPCLLPVSALHDRFPSQIRSRQYKAMLRSMGSIPMGNPLSITLLCRDKIRCQRWLEPILPMPPVLDDYTMFSRTLDEWQAAYLKPQFGALGANVFLLGVVTTWQNRCLEWSPIKPNLPFYRKQ